MLLGEEFSEEHRRSRKKKLPPKKKGKFSKMIEMKSGKISDDLKKQIDVVKKLSKSKNVELTKKEFKRTINILYRKKSDDIGDQVVSVFEVVRMAIVIGLPFCIHPALGLVTYIVDKIISEKVNEKSEGRIMSQIDRSIELCDKKLENEDITAEQKQQIEDMKEVLKTRRNNIENYYMEVKQYKQSDDYADYAYEDDDANSGWEI